MDYMANKMDDQITGALQEEEIYYNFLSKSSINQLKEEKEKIYSHLDQLKEHGLGDSDSEKEKFFLNRDLLIVNKFINLHKIKQMEKFKAYGCLVLGMLSCFVLGLYANSMAYGNKPVLPHQWFFTTMFGFGFICIGIDKIRKLDKNG